MKSAEQHVTNNNTDVNVSKTLVSGTVKGVQVPIICIPSLQYKHMIDDLRLSVSNIESHLSNCGGSQQLYNNIKNLSVKELKYLVAKMMEIYDYQFNEDCRQTNTK